MNDLPNSSRSFEQGRSLTAKQEFLANWKSARERGALGPELAVNPYPGLRSFRPTEADLFFGRDTQIKELRNLLAKHNIVVVLGGSGSGKSSLVRAGLVPQLNSTSSIPDRFGAWYVAEFRPKLDPVNALFEAMFERIIKPRLSGASSLSAEGRARRIGALNAALDLQCQLDEPDGTIEWQCRTRLREILFDDDVIDVGALFDFVDERLQVLDKALSDGMTSGPPNLMLLVDQFEEVFKPKVDPAGRSMLMSLITSIHNYKPFNLFLIITMRSEELHRCSEFVGVTEVVNSSLYLVDLIGGRDIERAIVGPAQRLLRTWDLDPGDANTGPYTRRALRELVQVFDEGRESLRHPADQLPLMQHLLPLVWDKAVERWEARVDNAALQIDLEDLHALPGWKSPDGPLTGTLNERADAVLRAGVEMGASQGGGLDKEAVERLLRVAFCCLAQLDDRGNVVRDFATLDGMLELSGIVDQHPEQKETWKEALRAAFGVFERATLVNVDRNYDVNHEALIRGWKKYTGWLQNNRRLTDRLNHVDDEIHKMELSKRPLSLPSRVWKAVVSDGINVENLKNADAIAGDETSGVLEENLFGPDSAFSKEWVRKTLERADAELPSVPPDTRSGTQRFEAIKQTVRDAIQFRAGAKHRPVRILGGTLLTLLVLLPLSAYAWQQTYAQQDLNDQFRFFRLQSEATIKPPDQQTRYANQERELYAALKLAVQRAGQHAKKSSVDELWAVFRTSLRQLDKGTRSVLADGSALRVLSNSDAKDVAELAGLQKTAVNCGVADIATSDLPRTLIGPNGLGIELRPQMIGGVPTSTMSPIWRADDGAIAPIESSNFTDQPLLSGALVCLSSDANWLLTWLSLPGNQLQSPPFIQRIIWFRTGPVQNRDHRWQAELSPARFPATSQSYDDLSPGRTDINKEYPKLHQAAQKGGHNFHWFRNGDNVGFLIAMTDTTAVLSTTTGLRDPDPVPPGMLEHKLAEMRKSGECEFVETEASDDRGERQPFMVCEKGPSAFDGLRYMLRVRYRKVDKEPQLQSVQALNEAPCIPQNALCDAELRIEYDPPDPRPRRESLRASLQHRSSRIKEVTISEGYLWVKDVNGQVWRYVVELDAMKKLMPERWKGIEDEELLKFGYSDACIEAKCDTVDIPDWPKGQPESAK